MVHFYRTHLSNVVTQRYHRTEIMTYSVTVCVCVCVCVCLTLCDPMDYSLPGSSVHGVLQARILEWVAMPSSRGSS